jgi:transcriptional regulator with XRE-family HTH domain
MSEAPRDTPGWRAARKFCEWYQRQALTQTELGRLLDVNQSRISAIVNGKEPISVKLFDRVAALMGLPASDLISTGAALWEIEDYPVVAQVHELPPEVRRAFVDQWRAALDVYRSGRARPADVDKPPPTRTDRSRHKRE